MPGQLKPGLRCPCCHRAVIAVFHLWQRNGATFDYLHRQPHQGTCRKRYTRNEAECRLRVEETEPPLSRVRVLRNGRRPSRKGR